MDIGNKGHLHEASGCVGATRLRLLQRVPSKHATAQTACVPAGLAHSPVPGLFEAHARQRLSLPAVHPEAPYAGGEPDQDIVIQADAVGETQLPAPQRCVCQMPEQVRDCVSEQRHMAYHTASS